MPLSALNKVVSLAANSETLPGALVATGRTFTVKGDDTTASVMDVVGMVAARIVLIPLVKAKLTEKNPVVASVVAAATGSPML